jgi:hypothetical protein
MDESIPGFNYDDRLSSNGGPTLLDYLNFGGRTAVGVLGARNQAKPAAQASTNWTLIGGIAAAVLHLRLDGVGHRFGRFALYAVGFHHWFGLIGGVVSS